MAIGLGLFQGRGVKVSWNKGTLIKISSTTYKEPTGKNFQIPSLSYSSSKILQ